MLRLSVLALFVIGLCSSVARPDGKDDPLQKDLANLKGYWISASMKDGDKEYRRVLRLGKGDALLVVRQPGGPEPFKELINLFSAIEKDKRYLNFVGLLLSNEYRVEYELTGDKLKLKGSAGGIDVSGEWTRHKEKEKEKENGNEKEKKDPVAERIADQVAADEVLRFVFGESVKDYAIHWLAHSRYPAEYQFAFGIRMATYSPTLPKDEKHAELVKSTLLLATITSQQQARITDMKNEEWLVVLLKNRAAYLFDEKSVKNRGKLETSYNETITAEDAVDLAQYAAQTPKEFVTVRKQLSDALLLTLAKKPEIRKLFPQPVEEPAELRKSRKRVMDLIEEAQKKKDKLGTGRILGADKPDPVAERIADQLASYEILAISFARSSFGGKGVKEFALVRFSRSAEPIELQFARCLSIMRDGDLGSPTDLKDLVKVKISLDTATLKEVLKNPKFVEVFLKARILAQAAEDKDDIRKAFDNKWEISYNNLHTAEDAAKHLLAAAMVDSVTTKEHRETRKLLRDQILKALADNPEALKKLAQVPEPSDELRKSRERVKELMEKARKK